MNDKERLLQISTKQVFETGGNTITADDISFMFRYIQDLEGHLMASEDRVDKLLDYRNFFDIASEYLGEDDFDMLVEKWNEGDSDE